MSTYYIETQEKNYDYVIVEMDTVSVYDFLNKNESKSEAIVRGTEAIMSDLETSKRHFNKYGGDYWADQIKTYEKKAAKGCKVLTYKEFTQLQRKHLLDGKITKITEDEYNDMLNILPPLYWCTNDGVESFCMSEMYTGTYTTQFAKYQGNFYSKMVDCKDKSTWIYNYKEDL